MFGYWKKEWLEENKKRLKLYETCQIRELKIIGLEYENASLREQLKQHALISVKVIDQEFVREHCPELPFMIFNSKKR